MQFRNLTRISTIQVQRRMRTKLGHSTRYAGVRVSAVPGGSAAPPSPAIFLSLSLLVSCSTPQYPATDSVSGLSLVSVPIIDENIIDLILKKNHKFIKGTLLVFEKELVKIRNT